VPLRVLYGVPEIRWVTRPVWYVREGKDLGTMDAILAGLLLYLASAQVDDELVAVDDRPLLREATTALRHHAS
jgi:hypothetical protein